jgi:polyhydroxybutyrate depolymerase
MTWLDPANCSPDAPVRALQIHGTDDPTVAYDGGIVQSGSSPFPSATESAARWAGYGDCDATPVTDGQRDYSSQVPGAETTVTHYGGCQNGSAAELWSMEGETHLPDINDAWRNDLLDFLLK